MKRMNFIFRSGALIFLLLVVGLDFAAGADQAHGDACTEANKAECKDPFMCQKGATVGDGKTADAGGGDCGASDADCKCVCKPGPDLFYHGTKCMPKKDGGGGDDKETSPKPLTDAPMSSGPTTKAPTEAPEGTTGMASGSNRVIHEPAALKLGMAAMGSFLVLLLSSP